MSYNEMFELMVHGFLFVVGCAIALSAVRAAAQFGKWLFKKIK